MSPDASSLQKTITGAQLALQKVKAMTGEDSLLDKTIVSIEQQKGRAICDLVLVNLTLNQLKPKLEGYNKKIKSSLKEDILSQLLNSLETQRKKLSYNAVMTPHREKKIKVVNEILNTVVDELITRKSIKDIINSINKVISDYENYDALRKRRKTYLSYLTVFRGKTSLSTILDQFMQDMQRLESPTSTPVIASPLEEALVDCKHRSIASAPSVLEDLGLDAASTADTSDSDAKTNKRMSQ